LETSEESTAIGIVYECISCKERVTAEQLAITPEIKCPICGYRVLKKIRPQIVKHIKSK
jgi:DNA-directed RNA polymerase subunit RPC12/RpoP